MIVPLAREQAFLGAGLVAVGLPAVAIAGISGSWFVLTPLLFLAGAALALLGRAELGLGREPGGDALPLPPLALVEDLTRTALRVVPALVIAGAFLALAAAVEVALAAPVGGLIVGQGIVELQVVRWATRWERRHGVVLYRPAEWFVLRRSGELYRPGRR